MNTFKELREKYRSKFKANLVSKAVEIALNMSGAMTPAVKKIEALKKGLSDDPVVKDALKLANESVQEGKYSAYSDLLLMKARVIDKEGPKSNKLPAIDAQIKVVMKRLGIKESTEVKEGTWDIPDTKTKLQKLMDLVSKPYFATTEKEVDKYLTLMPFGDDELYDDLGVLYFIPGSQKSKKFPKTDLNQVAMDSLNGRWLTAKKKGKGWDITHINFDIDMDETIKRKSGNIRPGRRMKVDLSAGSKY